MKISRAVNIEDLRIAAKRALPRMVFDYIDGGADDEITLRKNTERLRAHELIWDCLVDVTKIDTRTKVMGSELALPFVLSPTALQRMFHVDGEKQQIRDLRVLPEICRPAQRCVRAEHRAQERGLAGAVGSHDTHAFARKQRPIQGAAQDAATNTHRKLAQLEQRLA